MAGGGGGEESLLSFRRKGLSTIDVLVFSDRALSG